MKIKNVSNKTIVLYDLRRPDDYIGLSLDPGKETIVFDEDAERSENLSKAVQLGYIQIISEEEPYETEEVDLELSNKIAEALDRIKKLEEEGGVTREQTFVTIEDERETLPNSIPAGIIPPTFAGLTSNGDIEITDSSSGVILKSPSGKRFKLRIKDNGVLETEEII